MLWLTFGSAHITGCSEYEYCPIVARSPVDGTEYRCETKLRGEVFFTTLSGPGPQTLRCRGKPQALAISSTGDAIAFAVTRMGGPNEYGHLYLSDEQEIVFADAKTLQVTRRWLLRTLTADDRVRFDEPMAFSPDGTIIMLFFYGFNGKHMVGLWDVESGQLIMETTVPSMSNPSLADVTHFQFFQQIALSPDRRFMAVSGGWSTKTMPPIQTDGFLAILCVPDESWNTLKTHGYACLYGPCFDTASSCLACWGRDHQGTANVVVLGLPEGNVLATWPLKGRVLGITAGTSRGDFRIRREDGSDLHVNPYSTQEATLKPD